MKEHLQREMVNELRDIAKRFAECGCLRDVISRCVSKWLDADDAWHADHREDNLPLVIDAAAVERGARAIWDWEHEGRKNAVLDVEWSLLNGDYEERAKVCIESALGVKAGGI